MERTTKSFSPVLSHGKFKQIKVKTKITNGSPAPVYKGLEAIECLHIKELAVKCMEGYISHQKLSDKDKEELKQNHKQWADMALKGLKQRLREIGKIR